MHERSQGDTTTTTTAGKAARPAHAVLALQRTAGNRAVAFAIQRVAVNAKNLGAGPLTVDTGGDFDTNHTAADWADAVARSGRRAGLVAINTIVKDTGGFKALVGAADYDTGFVSNGKFRDLRVAGIEVWQINTAAAKAGTLPTVAPPATPKVVDVKNGLAAADGKEKSPGAYSKTTTGPVFLATGIRKVQ